MLVILMPKQDPVVIHVLLPHVEMDVNKAVAVVVVAEIVKEYVVLVVPADVFVIVTDWPL